MREIIFRGKRKDNGEWVEGSLTQFEPKSVILFKSKETDTAFIFDESFPSHLVEVVIPETVGQYTGLTDKNGKMIFEGDIVRTDKGKIYEIKMQKGCWIVWNDKAKMTYDKWDFLNTFAPTVEVIGNIHDNPELLKGGG